jgi:tetratricopeptide (TPR) repeat protein
LAADSGHRDFRAVHATALGALGRYEEALHAYRALAAEAPEAADVHLSIGHALKTLGRRQEAIDAYRRAAAVRPGFGDAYWSLANLKTYRFTDEEIARMRAFEAAAATTTVDRYHLCFALGKALEDRAEYAGSFRHYERGNALKKAEISYEPEQVERAARLQMQVCTREFLSERRGFGCPRADPIFIVGLPRAGSTLLEQILASHSLVEGTLELAEIPRLVNHLQGRPTQVPQMHGRRTAESEPAYPRVLAALTPLECARFGAQYLADTAVYRAGAPRAKPFFIDKMPNNFRHLGLIHLILPNARIIDARREPMACCFSNFKQLFASGQEFTYALEDIARYYRSYVELMDHWNAALPGKILRVQYEELVRDLDGSVRRLLAFCGLDFEPACLEFYRTERSVRTASSEQVRRPIFMDGLDQWRRFEPWLGPLRTALGPLAAAG